MKKILLVPLDDRPCNLKFPLMTAASCRDVVVSVPPANYLGKYKTPGSPEKICSWLERSSADAEAAVISADMLCLGGLVASRTPAARAEEAVRRLSVLTRLRKENPKMKIYLHSVLMRLSITADSKENEGLWKKIFERSSDGTLASSADIPENVLADYQKARKRNHALNLACIDLAADGTADLVVISKEDCALTGPHKDEEVALRMKAASTGASARTMIVNGADEIGACLVARHLLSQRGQRPRIAVRYSFGKGSDVSLYEDVPLDRVVSDHLELVGVERVEPLKDAEKVFFVHSFAGAQKDLMFSQEVVRTADERHHLKNFCSEIVMMEEIDREAFVADVFYANGSDSDFMEKFAALGDPKKLLSYAGWNTSANAVGSALAAAVVPAGADLLLRRYAEDLGYQSVVRKKLRSFLDGEGISNYDLSGRLPEAEAFASREMKKWGVGFFPKIGLPEPVSVNLAFPWGRTFECDCDIIFP